MWLLDHNVPKRLLNILQFLSIPCDSAYNRGWSELGNGELVKKAIDSGFSCILTKDKLFSKSAEETLKHNPKLAVVLLTIRQSSGKQFSNEFLIEWEKMPIKPLPGQVLSWPK